MLKALGTAGIIAVVFVGAIVLRSTAYTIDPTEQAIITQFGKPIGDPVKEPGLHFRKPFIEEVNRIDRRVLEWDGLPSSMPTKDKVYIVVDTFARWRIIDARQFFERIKNERSAMSRLNDILGSETRNTVARHEFIEIVRTGDRQTPVPEETTDVVSTTGLLPITRGRTKLEGDIFEQAKGKLTPFGIELLDIRFKRINYNENVSKNIFSRMVSERQQIAEQFKSEGAGEAARIEGNKERELQTIESGSYKTVQEVKGAADAQATQIYADAYNQSPEAIEFYEFLRTMESYELIVGSDTTLILTTNSDIFKLLKSIGNTPGSPATARRASPSIDPFAQ